MLYWTVAPTITLCHRSLLDRLGVKGSREVLSLTTLEKSNSKSMSRVAELMVTDMQGKGEIKLHNVHSREDLPIDTENLVTASELQRWSHLKRLPLCNGGAKEVMLLIGQGYPDALVPLASVKGKPSQPYAIKTRLGWTVSGPVAGSKRRKGGKAMFIASREECLEEL